MIPNRVRVGLWASLGSALLLLGPGASAHEPVGEQTFASPQSNPIALSPNNQRVYVANTTSGSVDVIDTGTNTVIATVPVGLDPVSVAVRPDGREVWVSNHVSDSVSVIDTDPASPTLHHVVDTIQSMGPDLVTTFDEPVGIAFASNQKAYVALSSRNQVAIVDVASRRVTGTLEITAQDPRALTVNDGLLFVTAFESMNQTELSSCPFYQIPLIGAVGGPPDCTLGLFQLLTFISSPNIPGEDKNIVVDDAVPDRDLFVFDTSDDSLVDVVSGVGTLLYGVAADAAGRAYVTNTDARNAENGLEGDGLVDLDNRMFDNRITAVSCSPGGCGAPVIRNLDDPVPSRDDALATPFGVAVSVDGSTLVVTAAASSRLFTVDASSGNVLGVLDLGSGADLGRQIPRGVALRSRGNGMPRHAYVLNTLENTVSVVNVRRPNRPRLITKIPVGDDPTDDAVRRGRIAFNSAHGADSGNFACASCHPDGNTDQLVWRIGGACSFGACSGEDEPRLTMPVRGLRNTVPLHWDGTLGDPFGGVNGAVGLDGDGGTQCALDDADGDLDCFRDLVDASQSGVMCDQAGGCASGPTGLPGRLTDAERDDMAVFLTSVAYPPARSRRLDDRPTDQAIRGYGDFFTDKGTQIGPLVTAFVRTGDATSCASSGCHELPLMASTNSSGVGAFDAPTLRGLSDRFIHFSNGLTASRDTLEFAQDEAGPLVSLILNALFGLEFARAPEGARWDPAVGYDERTTFAAVFTAFTPQYNVGPLDIFRMTEEFGTGFSGATGRQVSLNARTATGAALAETGALLDALEAADRKGLVNLRAEGLRRGVSGGLEPITLSYRGSGLYEDDTDAFTRAELVADAAAGDAVLTVTAALGANVQSADIDQPLIWTDQGEAPLLPVLPADNPMQLHAADVVAGSTILVDGAVAAGRIDCVGGAFGPTCDSSRVALTLDAPPTQPGLHLVQVVTPGGLVSNDMPFCVERCD